MLTYLRVPALDLPLGAVSVAISHFAQLSGRWNKPQVLLPLPEEPGCGSSCSCLCQQTALATKARESALL